MGQSKRGEQDYSGSRIGVPRSREAKWRFPWNWLHKWLCNKGTALAGPQRAHKMRGFTEVSELPYAEAILPSGLFLQEKATLCDLENG
jgi:hypothetical protein